MPRDMKLVDAHGRVLELRLAGNRIDRRIHHGPDARVGRHLIVPVNRHEHAAARHAAAVLHACDHRAPTARHSREVAFAHAAQQRILRMHVDERLRHMAREFSDLPVRVIVCHWSRTRPC